MQFNSLILRADDSQDSFVQDWHMNRALRAKDVERIPWLVGRVSHREYSARPPLKLKQSRRGVFNFSREEHVGGHRLHLRDRSEDIRQHFDTMTAEIKHRSAAGALFVEQPGTRMIGSGIEPLEGIDLRHCRRSELTCFNHFLDACYDGVKVTIVSHAQLHIVGAASG